ncbi:transcription factor subunit Med10 of mediator complex-domain-containing protein [Gymnopilus junonius]|uniref:Mediator of RNA polymerase II transcription subunit 10 n=1 Tax=Gymnopilus junonius TaxID=109634 RepID=A0A9P5TV05_GYMJU|nr:transcription factor subunit Med10 of mediator complex-domain-containing protein [Gymnopilus junonius]
MAQPAPAAPDSPRSEQTPPPPGMQGDFEQELMGLANSLYNLGVTVINDTTRDLQGGSKPVGPRVNDVVSNLSNLDDIAQHLTTMIPMQVLADIDNSRNPMQLTKERLERAAAENQFMNGKIAAINSYRQYLDEAIAENFPELETVLKEKAPESNPQE